MSTEEEKETTATATENPESSAPPFSPAVTLGPTGMHKGVVEAVHHTWNCNYPEAEKILATKKDTNPRYSLEWANCIMMQGLMSATNEQREEMLEIFQSSDNLATKLKYGAPMDADVDEDDEAMWEGAEQDMRDLSEEERKMVEEHQAKKKKEGSKDAVAKEKSRNEQKAAFKKAQDEAKKSGAAVDQSWKLECDVIYADSLLVRSLVQLAMNSYMKGGYNLRRTWGCYLALMKELENDKDHKIPKEIEMNIKYGAGLFYCYLALVPAGLMKLLSAIGFISDKELGEQLLTEVEQSDSIRSPCAAMVLLTYYLFLPTGLGNVEETLGKAKLILDKMNTTYPDNAYFYAYGNHYHRKRGETKEAVMSIQKSLENAKRSPKAVPVLLKYLLGDTLYMDLQFANARDAYMDLLDTLIDCGQTFSYTGQVVLSLAGCYQILGQEDEAMMWVKRVENMFNPKSKQDANSPKFAARCVAEPRLMPLLPYYVLYINRDLTHMKGQHVDKLLGLLKKSMDGRDTSNVEVDAMVHLFKGVMNKGCNRKTTTRDELQIIFDAEKKLKSNSLVLPYAYYEMGEMEYRAGNLQEAKKLFDKGQTFSGDNHETLENRYTIAQKQLKRAMAEKGLS